MSPSLLFPPGPIPPASPSTAAAAVAFFFATLIWAHISPNALSVAKKLRLERCQTPLVAPPANVWYFIVLVGCFAGRFRPGTRGKGAGSSVVEVAVAVAVAFGFLLPLVAGGEVGGDPGARPPAASDEDIDLFFEGADEFDVRKSKFDFVLDDGGGPFVDASGIPF